MSLFQNMKLLHVHKRQMFDKKCKECLQRRIMCFNVLSGTGLPVRDAAVLKKACQSEGLMEMGR